MDARLDQKGSVGTKLLGWLAVLGCGYGTAACAYYAEGIGQTTSRMGCCSSRRYMGRPLRSATAAPGSMLRL